VSNVEDRYPPKNRTNRTDLGAIDIEIGAHRTTLRFDANQIIKSVLDDELFPALGDPIPAEVEGSILSGKAGYRYSDIDVEMVLERGELERLIRHDLTPDEYFKLRAHFGMFFMIHEDYFDAETGEAIEPLRPHTFTILPPGGH
jgi:hypothetical protein